MINDVGNWFTYDNPREKPLDWSRLMGNQVIRGLDCVLVLPIVFSGRLYDNSIKARSSDRRKKRWNKHDQY